MFFARGIQPSLRSILYRKHLSAAPIHIPNRQPPSAMQKTLDFDAGPLVWIDCEMTGLDPKKERILEIGVLITNGNLDLVDDGIQFVIQTEKSILDGMDEWCTKQHASSGLTEACLTSPHSKDFVYNKVLSYIKSRIPTPHIGVLSGSSVHSDRSFLVNEMPGVVEWLHYRIVDVYSIQELCRRWYPGRQPSKDTFYKGNHRALDDIRGSLQELKWYREHIFTKAYSFPAVIRDTDDGATSEPIV